MLSEPLETVCETICNTVQAKIKNMMGRKSHTSCNKVKRSHASSSDNFFFDNLPKVDLSTDSSDDEFLKNQHRKQFQSFKDKTKSADNEDIPLALRKKPKRSYKNKNPKSKPTNQSYIDGRVQSANNLEEVVQPFSTSIPTHMVRKIFNDFLRKNENKNIDVSRDQQSEQEINKLLNEVLAGTDDGGDVETLKRQAEKHAKNKKKQKKFQQPPKKKLRKSKSNEIDERPSCSKSNLAKYVESFANDCYLPGSATPSSSMSTPIVTSTTQNYDDVVQPALHTYPCFIDWSNDGEQCQLDALNSQVAPVLPIESKELNQDETNAPFQDFVSIDMLIDLLFCLNFIFIYI